MKVKEEVKHPLLVFKACSMMKFISNIATVFKNLILNSPWVLGEKSTSVILLKEHRNKMTYNDLLLFT